MRLLLAANNQATRRNEIIKSYLQLGSSSNRYAPRLPQQETKSSTKQLPPTGPILGPENILKTGFAQKGLPSSTITSGFVTLSHYIISYHIILHHVKPPLEYIWHHRCCFPELESATLQASAWTSATLTSGVKNAQDGNLPYTFCKISVTPAWNQMQWLQGHPEQKWHPGWQGMICQDDLPCPTRFDGLFYGLFYCSSLLYAIC